MSSPFARRVFPLAAAAGVGMLVFLGWKWSTPIPDPGEIVACIAKRFPGDPPDYKQANQLAGAYLKARGDDPLSKLFYYFPPDAAEKKISIGNNYNNSFQAELPRDRIYSLRFPMSFRDLSPSKPADHYMLFLEVEGREPRSYGPVPRNSHEFTIPLTPLSDFLGSDGACGRFRVVQSNGTASEVYFQILPKAQRAAVDDRLYLAKKLTNGHEAAYLYFTAMIFASEGCFGDAYHAIESIPKLSPGDPLLNSARIHCLQKLAGAL